MPAGGASGGNAGGRGSGGGNVGSEGSGPGSNRGGPGNQGEGSGASDDQRSNLRPFTKKPPPGPTVFEQAGDVQSAAALEAAQEEVTGFDLAMQEFRDFISGDISQFASAGLEGLAGVQEGSTTPGLADRLNEIMNSDVFSGVVDERFGQLQNQLGVSGLRRSGTALEESAALPLDVALALEQQQFGRQQGLAEQGLGAIGTQGDFARGVGGLQVGRGGVLGEGIRGAAEAEAGGILGEKQFEFLKKQNSANRGGGSDIGDTLIKLAPLAIAAFSDPRLKTNVRNIGKIGVLDLIKWDWIPEVAGTIVENTATIGFMSTQVKEHYPDLVVPFGGFDTVKYGQLVERLNG